jgi:hypothetical protein
VNRVRRLLMGVALTLTACAGPRNGLNTTASTCFRGLPAAADAVGHKGTLVGVRRVRTGELAHRVAQAGRIPAGSLCLIAYRGQFAHNEVPGADPSGPGAYAVVALDDRGARVLATFVLDQLPVRFQHNV